MKREVFRSVIVVYALLAFVGLYPAAGHAQDRVSVSADMSSGVRFGKPINLPKPPYPMRLRRAKIQGVVQVRILIDKKGSVYKAEAVSGPKALQSLAVRAAFKARFTAALVGGKPIKVSGLVSYHFIL